MNPRAFAIPWFFVLMTGGAMAPPAQAALSVGAKAPDFATTAVLAGTPFDFHLAKALRKGPVVLYFYPKAFASQCTIEAHAFAEAVPQFKALGASVIGVSNDSVETLKLFSVTECRSKFAVVAAAGTSVVRQYDALRDPVKGVAERISYVISPQGRVVHVHAGEAAETHVEQTLAALKKWKKTAR